MRRHTLIALALVSVLWSSGPARGALIVDAPLRNGDYGGGLTQQTMSPNHGGSPGVLGIADGPTGVTFTPTESDGRSNAVIYWQPGTSRSSFRQHGAISVSIYVDETAHSAMDSWASLWCDNYGWDRFRNGQATFSVGTSPRAGNGRQFSLSWSTWHNNVWYNPLGAAPPVLDYDRWYELGFAWGGPDNDFEFSVDGWFLGTYDLPSGISLPWGMTSSAENWGLGSLHERGIHFPLGYGSNSGVTYADLMVWDEYVQLGRVIPEPATIALLGLGAVALLRKRRA